MKPADMMILQQNSQTLPTVKEVSSMLNNWAQKPLEMTMAGGQEAGKSPYAQYTTVTTENSLQPQDDVLSRLQMTSSATELRHQISL